MGGGQPSSSRYSGRRRLFYFRFEAKKMFFFALFANMRNTSKSENNESEMKRTVRHVTGTGSGLLEEIPRSGVQISASTKRATIGVRAPYATRCKLRYESNQVWMNTTFISQGPQSSGI
jgi:hypothetical protein